MRERESEYAPESGVGSEGKRQNLKSTAEPGG